MRCVAGGERGEKKNEEAMGEGAHVLLAAAIMIFLRAPGRDMSSSIALPSGAAHAVTTAVKRGTYRGRPASQLIKRLSGKGRQA